MKRREAGCAGRSRRSLRFLTDVLTVLCHFNVLRRGEYTSVCITLRGNASDPYAIFIEMLNTQPAFPLSLVTRA